MQTSNTLGFEPAVVQKASEEIVNQITDSILAGKLKPGDSLPPERELIKMFARSRPTVREALRVLEMKGLISVTGGGGTVICKPETSQLEEALKIMLAMHDITPDEIYDARNMLEITTIRFAASKRTQEDIRELEGLIGRERDCVDNIELFTSLDRDFHELIARASKNCIFEILVRALRNPMQNTIAQCIMRMGPENYKKEQDILINCHLEILESIKNRSEKDAVKCMKEHIDQFKRINKQ